MNEIILFEIILFETVLFHIIIYDVISVSNSGVYGYYFAASNSQTSEKKRL